MSSFEERMNNLRKSFDEDALEIPHAPIGRRMATTADKDLGRWRTLLNTEFALLTPDEMKRSDQPFHMLLLHDLIADGDAGAAQEINNIFRKEERERKGGRYRNRMSAQSLKEQHDKLAKLAETLKLCHLYHSQGQYDASIFLRKQLGEKFMHEGDIWLAKHFYLSCLQDCKQIQDELMAKKIQAETHCLLAFLAKDNNDTLESALALAIDHLALCRMLSKNKPWQFKPRVLTIKLKKPIALHGLIFDEKDIYEIVDGCSMTIYMIATLLEHELLISLANQIMHSHKSPTDDDIKVAHEFADHALKLAMEVRHPTAMSSALVRFGLVLRHSGAYEDALGYFEQLKQHSILTADHATEAIAYHNIGVSLLGMHNSIEAIECFAKQMDIASDYNMKDLEADAMHEVGHVLLQEGYLWEAEECYAVSYDDFKSMHHTGSQQDSSWALLSIAAGHKMFCRFSALCRSNTHYDLYTILDWKCSRKELNPSHRSSYRPEHISKAYEPYITKMKPLPFDDGSDRIDFEKLADALELSNLAEENVSVKPPKFEGVHKSVAFGLNDVYEFEENYETETPSRQDMGDEEEMGDNEVEMRPRPSRLQVVKMRLSESLDRFKTPK